MSFSNPDDATIRDWLRGARSIAVVGLSPNPARPSHRVAKAMQSFGYQIIPVRPGVEEVLGARAYGSLADVSEPVDIVDVFRAPDLLAPVVDDCISRGFPRLWLQDGVINPAEAARARDAGIQVVMDRCIWRDYIALMT